MQTLVGEMFNYYNDSVIDDIFVNSLNEYPNQCSKNISVKVKTFNVN